MWALQVTIDKGILGRSTDLCLDGCTVHKIPPDIAKTWISKQSTDLVTLDN